MNDYVVFLRNLWVALKSRLDHDGNQPGAPLINDFSITLSGIDDVMAWRHIIYGTVRYCKVK